MLLPKIKVIQAPDLKLDVILEEDSLVVSGIPEGNILEHLLKGPDSRYYISYRPKVWRSDKQISLYIGKDFQFNATSIDRYIISLDLGSRIIKYTLNDSRYTLYIPNEKYKSDRPFQAETWDNFHQHPKKIFLEKIV